MTTETAIRERPILFNGEMVRAILDGRKTQTRRVIKFKPLLNGVQDEPPHAIHQDGGGNWVYWWGPHAAAKAALTKRAYPDGEGIPCPYGQPGDRLWVRETFWHYGSYVRDVTPGGREAWRFVPAELGDGLASVLRAPPASRPADRAHLGYHKRPSIFMERWMSRITLEITAVRAERLQQITWEDVCAEGVFDPEWTRVDNNWQKRWIYLWDSINAGRGYGWDANPWVWVIEFQRVAP